MEADRFCIRHTFREAARKDGEPVTPEELLERTEITADTIIEEYGSLANASYFAGVEYLNAGVSTKAVTGSKNSLAWRGELIQRLNDGSESGESLYPSILEWISDRPREATLESFGSWDALCRDAGVDPTDPNQKPLADVREVIREITQELDCIPSSTIVAELSSITPKALDNWFPDWHLAIEASLGMAEDPSTLAAPILGHIGARDRTDIVQAASLAAQDVERTGSGEIPNPEKECIAAIEYLSSKLEHRPSQREIKKYLPYIQRTITSSTESAESLTEVINLADVPEERDLTPTASMNRQPEATGENQIPSHTDLFRDLHIVHKRGQNTIEEDIDSVGIVDRRHYSVQFGGLSEAIAEYQTIDPRSYKDQSKIDTSPLIRDMISELSDILERQPIPIEAIYYSDEAAEEVLQVYQTWPDVIPAPADVCWSNAELLEEISEIGRELGEPPTPEQIRNYGQFPVETYIRRFGNWPQTLAAVGVETDPTIPEPYLPTDLTRRTWKLSFKLVDLGAGEPAIVDDLHRLSWEFGRPPTRSEYESYGIYSVPDVASEQEWSEKLDQIGLEPEQTAEQYSITRSQVSSAIQELAEELDRLVLPADVCRFTEYSTPLIIGEFGTIQAALEAAGVSAEHLQNPGATPAEAWAEKHWKALDFLTELRELDRGTAGQLTYRDVRDSEEMSTNSIYDFFSSFDEAYNIAVNGTTETVKTIQTDVPKRAPDESILGQIDDEFQGRD